MSNLTSTLAPLSAGHGIHVLGCTWITHFAWVCKGHCKSWQLQTTANSHTWQADHSTCRPHLGPEATMNPWQWITCMLKGK